MRVGYKGYTCKGGRSVFPLSRCGGEQTPRGESDVVQADVTLWDSANLALKYDLKVPDVAQRDLSHLPVVALISRQLQKEVKMPLTPPEHAERADSIARHVKVEPHLKTQGKWNMPTMGTQTHHTCTHTSPYTRSFCGSGGVLRCRQCLRPPEGRSSSGRCSVPRCSLRCGLPKARSPLSVCCLP